MSCSQGSQSSIDPISVEVWHHGDIGTTVRVTDAIEKAVFATPAFRRSSGRKPGTLVVFIPETVAAVDAGAREQLRYLVRFETSTGKALGETTGVCWGDELGSCAGFVVKQAELAAVRMKQDAWFHPEVLHGDLDRAAR
jgi:hypothetical protein